MTSFATLRDQLREDAAALQDRPSEREQLEAEGLIGRIGDLEPMGAGPPISARAIDMIVALEVSSEAAYQRLYRHPIWPRGRSGITIGIGYDVGYANPARVRADWGQWLAPPDLDLLCSVCGVAGTAAKALLPKVAGIEVPFQSAMAVFRDLTLAQTGSLVVGALPNAARLGPDSFGALVSLVYNRGASFRLQGERFREMREIREDVEACNFARVAGRIRSMKRLWQDDPDARGLLRRRELEATLFEEGLAAG